MYAKACLRVDFESVLAHFEFKIYQSKRKKILQCIGARKIILQCIRENFIMYQNKFYDVSEQVKKILRCIRVSWNFEVYQSIFKFLK